MKATRAYGNGYIIMPASADFVCEKEDGTPVPAFGTLSGNYKIVEPRLHEPVFIVVSVAAHVGGHRYKTVANGRSRPFELQPEKLYRVRKTYRGDGWSFSAFEVEEV